MAFRRELETVESNEPCHTIHVVCAFGPINILVAQQAQVQPIQLQVQTNPTTSVVCCSPYEPPPLWSLHMPCDRL